MTCQNRLVSCVSRQTAQQRVGCSQRASGLRPPTRRLLATDLRLRPLSRSAKPVAMIRHECVMTLTVRFPVRVRSVVFPRSVVRSAFPDNGRSPKATRMFLFAILLRRHRIRPIGAGKHRCVSEPITISSGWTRRARWASNCGPCNSLPHAPRLPTCTARRPGCGSIVIKCSHSSPLACAVAVIRWGAETSSDKLRRSARCTAYGHKGATIQRPSWGGTDVGFLPFPARLLLTAGGSRRI